MPEILLDLSDITSRTGLCRSTVYKLISKGEFPRQLKVGTCSKWRSSDIDAWLDRLTAARDARAA